MCVFSFGHKACRIQLPDQGLKLHPLHWKAASYPLDPKEVLGILFHSQLSLRAYFQRQATPSYLIVLFFFKEMENQAHFLACLVQAFSWQDMWVSARCPAWLGRALP